jgi:hypothetical protein
MNILLKDDRFLFRGKTLKKQCEWNESVTGLLVLIGVPNG